MKGLRLLAAMLCCVLFQLPVWSQGEPSYCNKLKFSIPFQLDPSEISRLREAQLYESNDGRNNWRLDVQWSPNRQAKHHLPRMRSLKCLGAPGSPRVSSTS